MKLGLDELIIVNPGSPARETSWFLGADGSVYRLVPAASQRVGPPIDEAGLGGPEPVPRFFLGDDGILYETR